MKRVQSVKRISQSQQKAIKTIESVKSLQEKFSKPEFSNTPLNDALDEAFVATDGRKRSCYLSAGMRCRVR